MRKFLVVLDDSHEALNAIRFAALRAATTGAMVQVLAVIPAGEIQHGIGVADVMRAEAHDRIEAHFQVFAKWMRERPGVEPELVIREGDPATELLAQIAADPQIGVCVLGAVGGPAAPARCWRACCARWRRWAARSPSCPPTCRANGWTRSPGKPQAGRPEGR